MALRKKNEIIGKVKNIDQKAATITVAILVAALGVILLSSFLLPSFNLERVAPTPREFRGSFDSVPEASRGALESFFTLRFLLSIANLLLLSYLLFTYSKDYLKLRSNFTLGIIAFLSAFFMYALSSFPLLHLLLGPYGISGVFSFVPLLFSAIGLLIFAKLGSE